jgi:hypothetical protein
MGGGDEWVVKFDGLNAVKLQVEDKEKLEGEIIIPKKLNNSLDVGWMATS